MTCKRTVDGGGKGGGTGCIRRCLDSSWPSGGLLHVLAFRDSLEAQRHARTLVPFAVGTALVRLELDQALQRRAVHLGAISGGIGPP